MGVVAKDGPFLAKMPPDSLAAMTLYRLVMAAFYCAVFFNDYFSKDGFFSHYAEVAHPAFLHTCPGNSAMGISLACVTNGLSHTKKSAPGKPRALQTRAIKPSLFGSSRHAFTAFFQQR
ncbi:hypothetical protein ACT3UJ_17795 [Halomonas sp. 86]|uniref:hypothetical protein n=1 Tax=unclassified Halomonas TaxID=2609666 RepID=UPI004033AF93